MTANQSDASKHADFVVDHSGSQANHARSTLSTEAFAKTASAISSNALLAGEGIVSGALFTPINGASQLLDHALGVHLGTLKFGNQNKVDSSFIGRAGEFAGMTADFLAISKVTGSAADSISNVRTSLATRFTADPLAETAVNIPKADFLSKMIANSKYPVAGAVQGMFFSPSQDSHGSFFLGRLENAGIETGSVTLGVAGANLATRIAGEATTADAATVKVATVATHTAVNGGVGAIKGALSTEIDSLASRGELASSAALIDNAKQLGVENAAYGGTFALPSAAGSAGTK